MENLFFLVIVLIIIVSNVINIRRRVRGQQTPGPEDKKKQASQSGWKKSLENLMEQLKEEFEPLSDKPAGRERVSKEPGRSRDIIEEEVILPKASERSPGWQGRERVIERSYSMEGRESALDRQSRDKSQYQRRAAVERKDSEAIRGDATVFPERKPGVAQTPAQAFSSRSGSTYSIAQLQTAVIWSEILGHPVALRKGRRDTWL